MKAKIILFLLAITSIYSYANPGSLQGSWRFAIDPNDVGLQQKWQNTILSGEIQMPGSLQSQGFGNDISTSTKWTGDIQDSTWFRSPDYAIYREKGNVKVPFWLNPDKQYVGVAWYQHDFETTKEWKGDYELELERVHWGSTVFVDGKEIGQQNSLSTPHRYSLSNLKAGKHTLTIRIDNRMLVDVGQNAHSVTDHTQTNWNGFIGEIELTKKPKVFIDHVIITPNIHQKTILANVILTAASTTPSNITCQIIDLNDNKIGAPASMKVAKGKKEITKMIPLGNKAQLWSEFTTAVYKLQVTIDHKGLKETKIYDFGLREFKAKGTRFEVNGTPIFLRGTLNCCEFPLTGYPSMDAAYWAKIYRACKSYGLNHVRFHSWCPPEVAFEEADKAGIYLLVECTGWANIGDGHSQDKWFYDESERIVKEYGNHPSFCMMEYGNEPNGKNLKKYLTDFVNHWKSKDSRRVYTGASGWPYLANADYNSSPDPRIQRWGEGLKSIINAKAPNTMYDWKDIIVKDMPTVSHEIGQWCVYPDFKEIKKYTGFLKAHNFEIFKDGLKAKGMANYSELFLYASGKLQTLCYKADIEAALRTPGFAGFQLLGLEDFPGQGTALVGVLNAFWESKGYVSGESYSRFCNSVVPLVRFPKMTWTNNETIDASIEMANFSGKPLNRAVVEWTINDKNGTLAKGEIQKDIPLGNCIPSGVIHYDCQSIQNPTQLKVEVSVKGTSYQNSWNIWVYPSIKKTVATPFIADQWNEEVDRRLKIGENVLLLTRGKVLPEKGGNVSLGFSSIFWNTAWTKGQPPHTLGILCNPLHPILSAFPTDSYSDYQWWDILSQSDAMILDAMPQNLMPDVQVIDDWVTNHKLALLFETKVGKGKLVVCSVDLMNNLEKRPAAAQLKQSILEYMASKNFQPEDEINPELIKALINK